MFLKFFRLPKEDDNEPCVVQLTISSVCESIRLPIAESIVLGRLHSTIFKLLKNLKLLTEEGAVIEKLHPTSVKLVNPVVSNPRENWF